MNPGMTEEARRRQESIFRENLRHYAIWHFIRYKRIADFINDSSGKHILDVGCGIGLLDLLIVDKDIIGIDIDPKNLREAKRVRRAVRRGQNTVNNLVGDLHHFPFDRAFDILVCSEVLEHLAQDRPGLAALIEVLKEDGLLLLTLPNRLRLEIPQLLKLSLRPRSMQSDHVREYKVGDISNLVKSFPLRIEKISGVYLDFPLFHILDLPFRVPQIGLHLPRRFRFFIYLAFYKIYQTLWVGFESLFWPHAYHILIILKKSSSSG